MDAQLKRINTEFLCRRQTCTQKTHVDLLRFWNKCVAVVESMKPKPDASKMILGACFTCAGTFYLHQRCLRLRHYRCINVKSQILQYVPVSLSFRETCFGRGVCGMVISFFILRQLSSAGCQAVRLIVLSHCTDLRGRLKARERVGCGTTAPGGP